MADQSQSNNDINEVYSSMQNSLRNYLRRRVEESAVDDLLHDIFLKGLKAIHENRSPHNLPGWLHTVARTTVADHYRSKSQLNLQELQHDTLVPIDHDEGSLEPNLASCLRPLINQLPEIYKTTLLATDFSGQTIKSVAHELEISVSAVKSRVSRARNMLKQKLLACCPIEFSGTTITDYQCPESNPCGESC